ncbi:hypothetical protein RUU25_03550, partial [Staphylococcus borealis]|uniref:hypothetical protein n=1 Tax=Staphylococcus borealis TaxID=2742203 RepID=UPI003133F892
RSHYFAWQRPTLAERKSATIAAKNLTLLRGKRSHLSSFSKIACSFSSTKLASQFSQLISFKRFLLVKPLYIYIIKFSV